MIPFSFSIIYFKECWPRILFREYSKKVFIATAREAGYPGPIFWGNLEVGEKLYINIDVLKQTEEAEKRIQKNIE